MCVCVCAELEGKDVEEVFTAVLSPNGNNSQSEQSQHTYTAAGSKTNPHHAGTHTHTNIYTHSWCYWKSDVRMT